MASDVDTAARRLDERTGQQKRVADAHAESDMQLPHECEPDQRAVGYPSRYAASLHDHIGYGVLGEEVVDPFLWRIGRKRCNGNVIGSHGYVP
jgi:hypothetical protein